MDIIDGLFKQHEFLNRRHRSCPPASGHNGQEDTVLATRGEIFPAPATLSALGERPRLGGSPFRLTCSPPADPFGSVSVGVVDNGHGLP